MSKSACSAIQRVGFMRSFIFRKPTMTHMNDPGLANLLYRSVNYFNVILGLSKAQMGSFNGFFVFHFSNIYSIMFLIE